MSENTKYRSRSEIHNTKKQHTKIVQNTKQIKPMKRKQKKSGCLKWLLLIILIFIVAIAGYLWSLYRGVEKFSNSVYTSRPAEQQVLRSEKVTDIVQKKKPFSVLVLGVDTGELGRTEVGRSDVMMVVTVNANKKQTTIVSIPRDTRTEIVGRGTEDKINHAYAFGGVAMSVNSVQKLLGIPIDYTVTVNMGDFEKVVDALGGVDIAPLATFYESDSGYNFVQGQMTHMNGEKALAYVRNRNESGGDYGRQERQRQLVGAMLSSAKSIDTLTSTQSIFNSLESVVKTDVKFDEMKDIAQNYTGALGKVNQLQLSGSGQMIDGVYYDIPNPDSLEQVKQSLKSELEIQ